MPQFEPDFFSSLIFWEVISFGILLFVLYKYAFPGILSALEEREKKIKDSLDQAEQHRLGIADAGDLNLEIIRSNRADDATIRSGDITQTTCTAQAVRIHA